MINSFKPKTKNSHTDESFLLNNIFDYGFTRPVEKSFSRPCRAGLPDA